MLSLAEVQVWADAAQTNNLATVGTATQSTVGSGGLPARGIDGNTSGVWGNGSVTHTAPTPNSLSWWEVDLGRSVRVDDITLFNRTESNGNRLSDFRVSFLDAGRVEVFGEDRVAAVPLAGNVTFDAGGGIGRYVRVGFIGPNNDDNSNIMSLAEVQVMSENVAAGKTATQSSLLGAAYTPDKAVDGNLGNFTHTLASDTAPWWQVDLGTTHLIDSIILHNRDSCCADRLADIFVDVIASDGTTVVYTSPELNDANTAYGGIGNASDSGPAVLAVDLHALTGDAVLGQFVRVRRITSGGSSDQRILSLGEVQVYGAIPEPATMTLLALGALAMTARKRRRR